MRFVVSGVVGAELSFLLGGKRDECLPLALLPCCPLSYGEEPSISDLRNPHVLAGGMLDKSSGQEPRSWLRTHPDSAPLLGSRQHRTTWARADARSRVCRASRRGGAPSGCAGPGGEAQGAPSRSAGSFPLGRGAAGWPRVFNSRVMWGMCQGFHVSVCCGLYSNEGVESRPAIDPNRALPDFAVFSFSSRNESVVCTDVVV